MSKLKQAIALNVEHKKRHQELYDKMCSAKDSAKDGKTAIYYSCEIMRESTRHHEALRALGYRNRNLDTDGSGPIKDVHSEPDDSRHWLIRITKAWIEYRKRLRRLRDGASGFQVQFWDLPEYRESFPHMMEFKKYAKPTIEENFEVAGKIEGFCNMSMVNFERAWKKLGLDEDISRVWKDESEQEAGPKRVQRKRLRSRRA